MKNLKVLLVVMVLLLTAACGERISTTELNFTLEVIDADGNVTPVHVGTNQMTVGAALFEAEIIDAPDFVTYVNGIRADYTADGCWWQFFVDGEPSMLGVNRVNIEEGVTYAFVITPA
jgi:hypothetical protein